MLNEVPPTVKVTESFTFHNGNTGAGVVALQQIYLYLECAQWSGVGWGTGAKKLALPIMG